MKLTACLTVIFRGLLLPGRMGETFLRMTASTSGGDTLPRKNCLQTWTATVPAGGDSGHEVAVPVPEGTLPVRRGNVAFGANLKGGTSEIFGSMACTTFTVTPLPACL